MLCKSLADNDLESTSSRTTCYFFFKDDDDIAKSNSTALSVLLHQLFQKKPSLVHNAMDAYRAEKAFAQSFHQLWRVLKKTATDPEAGEIVCILDALDECAQSDRNELISALKAFYNPEYSERSRCRLKFFVTTRPYRDVVQQFIPTKHFTALHVLGEKALEAISHDIDIVLKERISELCSELRLTPEEQCALEKGLLRIKQRTFLWARLIVPYIRETFDSLNKDLEAIIRTIPPTVEKEYEAILSKIKDNKRPFARKLLHILVAATRPLSLKELNIAVAIEDQHKSYEDLRLDFEERFEITIRDYCGLFVTVFDQKVYLIHQTAKEFLVGKSGVSATGWQHSLEPVESELVIAKTCIAYLMFDIFDKQLIDPKRSSRSINKRLIDDHAYLEYAASFWAAHYKKSQRIAGDAMVQSILEVCKTQSQRFQTWFYVYWIMAHRFGSVPQNKCTLVVAAYFGHEVVVKQLLEANSKADIEPKDSYGRTPLSWAAERGHEAIVKQLLEARANIESKDRKDRTPLSWAAERGREAIVKQLLEAGANIESKDRNGRTPLSWAAERGREAIVKQLLEARADIESKDSLFGRTPLSWTAHGGQEAIVKQLLEAGADIESKDSLFGRTPLSWAAESGQEAVVKQLLEAGADIESKDSLFGRTPLSWAAHGGHEAVVKQLRSSSHSSPPPHPPPDNPTSLI